VLSRLGTTVVFAVLLIIAFLFLISGHWILCILFGLAAAASWFVMGVKRSTGR
jgi:hypothetical protein